MWATQRRVSEPESRRANAIQRLLVRNDLGARSRASANHRHAPTGDRCTRRADLFVAANVIGVRVRVDDVANGPGRQLTKRCEHRISVLRRPGIDENRAEGTDLHRDIRSAADDHVHVALDGHGVKASLTTRLSIRSTLCAAIDAGRHDGEQDGGSNDKEMLEHGVPHRFAGAAGGIGIASTFSMYSGYIVSEPPRVGSIGSRCSVANSVRYGFLPGK